jgi:3-hydroxyacyl-CoA dehydrogenase
MSAHKYREEDNVARATRYLEAAERAAVTGAVAGLPAEAAPVSRAAVIGAGVMGSGIAMCFANAGIPVVLIDRGEAELERARDGMARLYLRAEERGSISAEQREVRLALVTTRADLEGAGDVDLVVEAAYEDLAVKQTIFARLGEIARPGCILATNTSTLDVDAIGAASSRAQNTVGMHFFNPAPVMRLVEVVRGKASSPVAVSVAAATAVRLGKIPVLVGNCDGFVGNRMLARRTAQAERLLLEGALPQDIDRVLVAFGFPMGPFAMVDLAGLDVAAQIRKSRGTGAPIADAVYATGRLGLKSGRGYYRYEPGSRTPINDPEIERLISEVASRSGVARRQIADEEILERLLLPMVNEAARILEEGIAARPGDIDVVWVNGYGWPRSSGGPMHHADGLGLSYACERLRHYVAATGDGSLEPSPLLTRLASEGRRLIPPDG